VWHLHYSTDALRCSEAGDRPSSVAAARAASRAADRCKAGYDITVLADCCQGFSDELHDFAIEKTLPYYGSIATSTDFIADLRV
jgi:nicotinamidase-related amidase